MVNRLKKLKNMMLAIVAAGAISKPVWLLVAVPEMEKGQIDRQRKEVVENSRIIAELQQSVDIVDKRVDNDLELTKDRMRTMRFVPVVVSAYNPVVAQTDDTPEITASNKRVRAGMVALSSDLEEEYGFTFGDTVVIEGYGSFVFEDRMNKRWSRRVDILMISRKDAIKFGAQHTFLVVSN